MISYSSSGGAMNIIYNDSSGGHTVAEVLGAVSSVLLLLVVFVEAGTNTQDRGFTCSLN